MYKQLTIILVLILQAILLPAQTAIPLPGFQAVLKVFPTTVGDSITATFFITDFSNQWKGQDLNGRQNLVIWRNCKRYPITGIVQAFSTQVTLKLDKAGNPNLLPGVCALLQETPGMMVSHLISGITDSDKQCIDSYYRRDAAITIDTTCIKITDLGANDLPKNPNCGDIAWHNDSIYVYNGEWVLIPVNVTNPRIFNYLEVESYEFIEDPREYDIWTSPGSEVYYYRNGMWEILVYDNMVGNEGLLYLQTNELIHNSVTIHSNSGSQTILRGDSTVRVYQGEPIIEPDYIYISVDTSYIRTIIPAVPGPQGDPGSDGISIDTAYIGGDSLYIVLSTLDTINAGNVRGPQGATGLDGETGLITATDSGTIDFTYDDVLKDITGIVKDSSITPVKLDRSYENILSFNSGLSRSVNNITNNLITGINGNQTITGGTGAGQELTIRSTSHATKGVVNFGNSSIWDEWANRWGFGTTSPGYTVDVSGSLRVTDRSGTVAQGAAFDSNGKLINLGYTPGGVTGVTATPPLSATGGTIPNISMTQSNGSTNGWLSSGDWNTFNAKVGGSGSTNKLAFWNSSNALSSNSNLHVDNVNSRLYIGGSTAGGIGHLNVTGQAGNGYSTPINITSSWLSTWIKSYVNNDLNQRGISIGGGTTGDANYDHLLVLNHFSLPGVGIKTQYPLADLHITTPYAGSSNNGIRLDHNASISSVRQINTEGDIIFRSTTGHMSVGPLSTQIQNLNPEANLHLFAPGGFGEDEQFRIERAGGWGYTSLNMYVRTGGFRGLKLRDSYGGTSIFTTEQINKRVGIVQEEPAQTLDVNGTVRISGSIGTATSVVGRNASGDISNMTLSTGLSISGGQLTVSDQSATNELQSYTHSGTTSYTNTLSSGGGSFTLNAGSGISLSHSAGTTTISATGGGVTGSGNATQVAYWSGTSTLTGNSNLYWNNSQVRLGIGTATPLTTLEVLSPSGAYTSSRGILSTHGSSSYGLMMNHAGSSSYQLSFGTAASTYNYLGNSGLYFDGANDRIGVKAITPTRDLDVNGEVRIRDLSTGTTSTTLVGADATGVINAIATGTGLTMSSNTLTSSAVDVQAFTTPGTFTWTKPAGAKTVYVLLIGGGGGGAGGSKQATAVAANGGGGGQGGGVSEYTFRADDFAGTETVVVGAGGAGGAGATANSSLGTNGSPGGLSRFGLNIYANGGMEGVNQGMPVPVYGGLGTRENGGIGAYWNDAATPVGAAVTKYACSGGGGGGGISAANSLVTAPANGNIILSGGGAGGSIRPGHGGLGGAGSTSGNGVNGSTASSWYGGGGGGGGAARNGVGNGGAGGAGNSGAVLVISYL